MAEFCAQCSESIFGVPGDDMVGLVTEHEFSKGILGAGICEGCGPIMVDHMGNCFGIPGGSCEKPGHYKGIQDYCETKLKAKILELFRADEKAFDDAIINGTGEIPEGGFIGILNVKGPQS